MYLSVYLYNYEFASISAYRFVFIHLCAHAHMHTDTRVCVYTVRNRVTYRLLIQKALCFEGLLLYIKSLDVVGGERGHGCDDYLGWHAHLRKFTPLQH